MTEEGAQGAAPTTGNTLIEVDPDTTNRVVIWMEDSSGTQQKLNAYQLIVPWFASGGDSGSVNYLDDGAGNGGSISINFKRKDWVFEDQIVALPPAYNETPETIFGVFYATIQGLFTVPDGTGIRYLTEFDVVVSADACGTFELPFNRPPSAPPLTSLFNEFGANFNVDEFQTLTIEVACVGGCQDPCDDEDACTVEDACDGDTCVGVDVDCSEAGDDCNTASCDEGSIEGNCDILTAEPDGTPCDNGAGECIAGQCEPLPLCTDPCDDGNACTINDACADDICVGEDVNCSKSGDECNTASCSAAGEEGNCDELTPVEDGTPCEGGMCVAGECMIDGEVEARTFMAADGEQGDQPAMGATHLEMQPGETRTVMVWIEDNSAIDEELLNAYQLIIPFSAAPEDDATGSVAYVDIDPGQGGGNSVFLDTERPDWVYAGEPALPAAFNETPPDLFGIFYATIPGVGTDVAALEGIRYMMEFQMQASQDACGSFNLPFNLPPNDPPLSAMFNPFGGPYTVDVYQPLVIDVVNCGGCEDPCSDDDICTTDDACVEGICEGIAVDCSKVGDQCNVASCDGTAQESNCDLLDPVKDGTPCDDGQGQCIGGVCEAIGDCPEVEIVFLDPPNGVIDARQPHPTNSLKPRRGISELLVEAPAGAAFVDCWNLCESDERGFGPNGIDAVVNNGDGTVTILLDRVITEGAVTTVSYKGSDDVAVLTFHPANANGDGIANQLDIIALIDNLNGVGELPWDIYSFDIVHRGIATPLDILGLIDLLNGADEQDAWMGTELPDAGVCCTTDEQCDDGLFCTGDETCGSAGCESSGDPCLDGEVCDEDADECVAGGCTADADCDDAVDCTDDICEMDGTCSNTPNDAACDNGAFCDGPEFCDPDEGCLPGLAPCLPDELCDEDNDQCVQCGCFEDADCDDGIACTEDLCVPDCTCENTPIDEDCDDGLFCTGEEFCDGVDGCMSTGDPCDVAEICNEETDSCDAVAKPDIRVFMAQDGEQGNAPPTGPTKVIIDPGMTARIAVWLEDNSAPGPQLNAYQIIFPWSADPEAGATGTVTYVDNNPGNGGGDSVFIDSDRLDWVFEDQIAVLPPAYNETPTSIFGVFYATIQGLGTDPAGTGIRYLLEFDVSVSEDACGTFTLPFNLPPNAPPLTTLFNPTGGTFFVDEFQPLQINVPCGGACKDPCNDGNPCTINDSCVDDACMGQAVDCTGEDTRCAAAACDPDGAVGNCDLLDDLANGTPCEDGDPCSASASCQEGVCTPFPFDCDDGDPCTVDVCDAGDCLNTDIAMLDVPCDTDAVCQELGAPAAVCVGDVCDCGSGNNLNKPNTLCLDLRGAGSGNALGKCDAQDAGCGPAPDGVLQCTDNDLDPLNGGICVDQACYAAGELVTVDVELGPTSDAACGAQLFMEWDTASLNYETLDIDPDAETGWTEVIMKNINEMAGTIDLIVGLPVGVPCSQALGTTDGGTIARLAFEAKGTCKTSGVAFRPANPTSGISGRNGVIPVSGCNGASGPSGTDEMQINAVASAWTCPPSSTGPPDVGRTTREVLFEPIEVLDPCAQINPDSTLLCSVTFFRGCSKSLDCGQGIPCRDSGDCDGACLKSKEAAKDDCGGQPCVGFCAVDACLGGLCETATSPPNTDPEDYLQGGGDFYPGLTVIECEYTNDCGTTSTCEVEIGNEG